MEARVITSLQTSLDSRVPVAVGVYNGEVIVVCPGAAGVGVHRGAGAGLGHRVSSDTSLNLYKVYDATKEVSAFHSSMYVWHIICTKDRAHDYRVI